MGSISAASVVRAVLSGASLLICPLLFGAPPTEFEVQKLAHSFSTIEYGRSVAVSGGTALVGATWDDSRVGAAYIYTLSPSGLWLLHTKLLADEQLNGFGRAVALDRNIAVIGSRPAIDRIGSALVYERNPQTGDWSEQAVLQTSTGASIGEVVAISGDNIVLSGQEHDDDGEASVVVSVFTRDAGGVWSEQVLARGQPGDYYFGLSLAISGDAIVIGHPPVYGESVGKAHVYLRDPSGAWMEEIVLSDGTDGSAFGWAVAARGTTAVVSAPGEDAAYIYQRGESGAWSLQSRLFPSDGGERETFGYSAAIAGDTIIVGSLNPGIGSGSAYVFAEDATGRWSERAKLLASDPSEQDFFAGSVAVSQDQVLAGAQGANGAAGAAYAFDLDRMRGVFTPTLQCPGDVDGDDVDDLVLTTPQGQVRVKSLAGTFVNGFELAGMTSIVDTELMPDTNTNGVPELVALGEGPAVASVRDLLTGGDLGSVAFAADLAPLDLELVGDRTGNGIAELAVLGENPAWLEVRDGLTGAVVSAFGFANYLIPKNLGVYNGNGSPELAVLADNRIGGADKIEIRDTSSGAIAKEIWLGAGWQPLEQERVADLNGNGSAEVAVLRVSGDRRGVNVQVRDTVTRAWVKFVGFAGKYSPKAFVAIPDINGNGADELVVLGPGMDGSSQKAVIKDSKTAEKLGQLWFDKNFPGKDLVNCGDINGNGSAELALLGQRPSDGHLKVIVKDSKTGERLALLWFD